MRLVASATRTEIKSARFAPAIAPSDSPAAMRERIVAVSTPIVFEISVSASARSSPSRPRPLSRPLPGPSNPRTGAAAANAALIASAWACVIVPLVTSAQRTEATASSAPPVFAI